MTDPSGQLNVSIDTQMIFPQHLISVPVPSLLGYRRAGVRDSLESIARVGISGPRSQILI